MNDTLIFFERYWATIDRFVRTKAHLVMLLLSFVVVCSILLAFIISDFLDRRFLKNVAKAFPTMPESNIFIIVLLVSFFISILIYWVFATRVLIRDSEENKGWIAFLFKTQRSHQLFLLSVFIIGMEGTMGYFSFLDGEENGIKTVDNIGLGLFIGLMVFQSLFGLLFKIVISCLNSVKDIAAVYIEKEYSMGHELKTKEVISGFEVEDTRGTNHSPAQNTYSMPQTAKIQTANAPTFYRAKI